MRIVSVTAHAFGPLTGQTLRLAPGVTVVTGANESAKSSWHAAIYAAVCGRRRGKGAMSRDDRRFLELHRPWDGGRWDVGCVLELADGRRVELRHDLDGQVDCRAIDLATGADVSGEIIHDGSPDGSRWLGLDRRSFAATASVSQAELLAVLGAAGGLQEHLQRAAATAGAGDATASAALQRLDRFARDQVGPDRTGSTRPLRAALDAAARARREADDAAAEHAGYLEAFAAARVARAGADRVLREADGLADREAALRRAVDLAERAGHLQSALDAAEDRVLESAARMAELRRHVEAAGTVPPDATGSQDALVETLATELDRARAVARHHLAGRPAPVRVDDPVTATAARVGPVALRELAAQVDALTALRARGGSAGSGESGGQQRVTVPRAALGGVVLLSVLGVALCGAGQVVAGLVLLAAGALTGSWLVLRRRVPALATRVPAGLTPAHRDAADDQLQAVAARCRRLGVPPSPGQLREWAARAERVADQQQDWLRWEVDEQEHAALVADLERRLGNALARHEPHDGTGAAADSLDRRLEGYRAARAARQALLGGPTSDQARAALAQARDAHAALVAAAGRQTEALASVRRELQDVLVAARGRPDLPADELRAELRAELDRQSSALHRARTRATALLTEAASAEGAVRQRAESLPSVAEAEERLQTAEAAVDRLRELQRTLDLTRGYLARAQEQVHRSIAPVLAESLSAALPGITAGRYVEALVDPATLQVRVCGADRRWRDADRLSVGTAEQVYLLLRLALAEHLAVPGEPCPLLLDDVTVQADEQRTTAILEMLLEASYHRQVVIFAQEPLVAAWAQQRLPAEGERCAVVALPPL